MTVDREGWKLAAPAGLLGAVFGLVALRPGVDLGWWVAAGVSFATAAAMLFFFRDPERQAPVEAGLILAGADGTVTAVERLEESEHMRCACVRVCTYLGLLDVHINRAPLAGTVTHVSYERGRHLFTRQAASSDRNQHSAILIEAGDLRCLVKQIVGPLVRRVVTVLEPGQQVERGQRLGLMKFGSRLDIYLPEPAVGVLVAVGDRVRAGETVIARVRDEESDDSR